MKSHIYLLKLLLVCLAMPYCNVDRIETKIKPSKPSEKTGEIESLKQNVSLSVYELFFKENEVYEATGFDFPVGIPNAKNYYNAQKFGENNHLGDDWNGTGGGNSDLGDPVYSVANGYVTKAYDEGGGWGNVVRVIHKIDNGEFVESLYAHLDTMLVQANSGIMKGEKLGTIGTANGAYLAHLHLEIREKPELPLGGGYSADSTGYLNPTKFINGNRKVMWQRAR